eukprot:TRINITY_DN6761_c0_g1_i1.p1 TRINITY_DN6761_c0_g1~~TRINITY_DN6761_c0_g1_i1.p1  ORF type:complete len:265 (+),score=22.55 TRINITY_DN6761_c0_g1_i1:63-857(+)
MDAPQIFLFVISILNAVYALLAWFSAPTAIALNGFDHGAHTLMVGYGMTLAVLTGAFAAPVFSGPKAWKGVCQMSTFSYGTGVIIGAIGGNYSILGQSLVISAICAYFGFCYSPHAGEHIEVERDVSMCVKIIAALYPTLIFADGMQALFAPGHFLAMNNLGDGDPKLLQGVALVHVWASFAMFGSWISGPDAIRGLCRFAACAVSLGIVNGAVSGNFTMVGQAAVLSAFLGVCGFWPSPTHSSSQSVVETADPEEALQFRSMQ